jgi:hypothetical protein
MLRLNTQELVTDIAHIIKTGDLTFGNDNSLLKRVMMAEGNKWLTKPKNQNKRKVQFCIVSLRAQRIEDYERETK